MLDQLAEHDVGNRAVVERIDLEQTVAADNDRVLVHGRSGLVDDGVELDAGRFEVVGHKILELVVAQHGRERDLGPGGDQMLGDDAGAADIVDLALEGDAHRRRLGLAADHGAFGVAVDDRVADDVHAVAVHIVEHATQTVEGDVVALHHDLQIRVTDVGRFDLEERARRIDHVARREDQFAAVGFDDAELFRGLGREPVAAIFEALGEIVGLDERDIVERLVVLVDDDVVDHFEGGEIDRAQILLDVRTINALGDMFVGGEAGDQDVGLALGVE